MIYLLHGDNLVESRNFLTALVNEAKGKNQEILRLDGLTVKVEDFIQTLDSPSLFGGDRLIVIENLFGRPKSLQLTQILQALSHFPGDTDMVLWEKKPVSLTAQKHLPHGTVVKLFKIPALIFKFLDQLTPATKRSALTNLGALLDRGAPELVFYMVARQLRLLLLVANDEKIAGPFWMAAKLKKQATAFGAKKLLTAYKELCSMDESLKTGGSVMPLDWRLQMFIINHL